MIKLDAGNVLLKPCQRRHFFSSLRRALRMGSRLGDFGMTISLRREGRLYEVHADVRDRRGTFTCRSRQNDWRGALRELTRSICNGLHQQSLQQVA
jgi:hypothetical protein